MPLAAVTAALAALEEAAKFGQTEQGQRMIKDALDGGAKVEQLFTKIVSAFSHLFHHDTQQSNLVVTTGE